MLKVQIHYRHSKIPTALGVLVIRLTDGKVHKTHSTGLRIFFNEWDAENQCINYFGATEFRALQLKEIQNQLNESQQHLIRFFFPQHQRQLETPNKTDRSYFFQWMKDCTDDLHAKGQTRTAKIYESTAKRFRQFCEGVDFPMAQLDATKLMDFQRSMQRDRLCLNTISFYMRVIRAVVNKAVDEGLIPPSQAFRKVYTGIAKTEKRAVDLNILQRLTKLEIRPLSELDYARDIFLFSFYACGMAYVDLANLRKTDVKGEYIYYSRSKTKQALRVRVEDCMKQIIEKFEEYTEGTPYLLPVLYTPFAKMKQKTTYQTGLRMHNKRLVVLSKMLKLPHPLSSYVARHTWATLARRKGFPLALISEALGHSTENTTRIYLDSLEQSTLDNANRRLINLVG